ncbi:hypothetical protein V2G26_014434 [Clonostachys chloroleuca]
MSTTETETLSTPATTSSISLSSPFPFATAPDIIRSHQKDAYFTGHLTNTLTDLHRRLLGARATHAVAPELRTSASLLYFALTTLAGNRTLGEEYCDLVQLEGDTGKLPSLERRASYIAGSILLPYAASRLLPRSAPASAPSSTAASTPSARAARPPPASPALTLAAFYFSGTYYQLSKRLLSLRYVFTRNVPDTPDRAGYEVLGVLLVVQLAVQGYLHVRSTLQQEKAARERALVPAADVDVSLSHDNSYYNNNDLLLNSDLGGAQAQATRIDIASTTHTPVGSTPRYVLGDDKVMGFIKGQQQRKCTLCLEELRDPSATQCGHVFCWECIGDWVREKPECPLCRREALVQHILPLRIA